MSKIEIDNMEYASDPIAQAAYVTNATEIVSQSMTSSGDSNPLGDMPSSPGTEMRDAQSFTLLGELTLTAVEVKQTNTVGSPTGNWTLRIETDNAGEPSGTLANANASIVVSPPGDGNVVKGTFDNKFVLNGSTTYWLVIECDNQANGVGWRVAINSATYSGGVFAASSNGTWTAYSGYDLYFKIYGLPLQSYSESTIKTQGSYALKAIAAITDSLNKTLTKTLSPTVNLTGINLVKFDIRSSRTGQNIKVGLHNTYDSYTKALGSFDGANGATAYTDPIAGAYTFAGTAQLDTAQKKFGTASLLLDGNSDYVTLPDSDNWAFGTGDFTIDWWVRFNGSVGQCTFFEQATSGTDAQGTTYGVGAADRWRWHSLVSDSYAGAYYCSYTFVADTWYHLAVVRNGSSFYMFINGISQTVTEVNAIGSNSIGNYTGFFSIGYGSYISGTYYVNGHIDEFRISKGVARWTANFIPFTLPYITTHETTTNIAAANVDQTETIDLSAVSDANKDAIDKVVVTVVNADAANTFYIDNFGIATDIFGDITNQISPVNDVFGMVG